MRIFISQPMKDKTKEEILEMRSIIQQKIITMLTQQSQDEISFIDTLFAYEGDNDIQNKDLWFLARSLEALAQADKAFFPKDYALSRGCLIEYECAQRYHIPTGFYE